MLLSAVIIANNEEKVIGSCLQSLKGVADDMVVIDSGSTDGTEAICKAYNARFIYHVWEGYAQSKNFGNEQAKYDWVIWLDADEMLSEELRQSILAIKKNPSTLFFKANRLNNFCGKWIHHSGWYPDPKIRLFDRTTACWEGIVHEKLIYPPNSHVQKLSGDVLHFTYETLDDMRNRFAVHAHFSARQKFEQGKRILSVEIVPRTCFSWLRCYILRGGFLDGKEGRIIARETARYTQMKYRLLFSLQKEHAANTIYELKEEKKSVH